MDKHQLVSVIIPTFRRPEKLEECLRAVLQSDYSPFEVVVADDNGGGDMAEVTKAVVDRAREKGRAAVHYVALPTHQNGSAARNAGFRASRGAYVMFVDDDDLILPGKMGAQAAFLDEHGEEWGACYTRYTDWKNGKLVGRSRETRQGYLLTEELARNLFIHAGSNLMVRRSVVEALGGFDESFARHQDMEFVIRLLKGWKLGFVDVDGLVVHLHARVGVNQREATRHFLQVFGDEIDRLPPEDRTAVHKMLTLQQIRAALQGERDVSMARRLMREGGVSLGEVVGYGLHLVRRRLLKISCGYDMNKLRRRKW